MSGSEIAKWEPDQTALLVKSMFKYQLTDEEIERQKKAKVGAMEKKKFEEMIKSRINALNTFLADKVKPRIGMFTDRLEMEHAQELAATEAKVVAVKQKLDRMKAEEEEELELLKIELTKKFQGKRHKLEMEKSDAEAKIESTKFKQKRSLQMLKDRLIEKMKVFTDLAAQMHSTSIELLYTQVTNQDSARSLLEKIPTNAQFSGFVTDIANQSDDRVLQALLTGDLVEKLDMYCDTCKSFIVLETVPYDHDDYTMKSGLKTSRDKEETHKGKMVLRCPVCGACVFEDNLESLASPFRKDTHMVLNVEGNVSDLIDFIGQ